MKIEKGNTVIEDIMDKLVETKNSVICGCGNSELKMTMHLDMTDSSSSQYQCKCGNVINVTTNRSVKEQHK